jgi:hypothetical protein
MEWQRHGISIAQTLQGCELLAAIVGQWDNYAPSGPRGMRAQRLLEANSPVVLRGVANSSTFLLDDAST